MAAATLIAPAEALSVIAPAPSPSAPVFSAVLMTSALTWMSPSVAVIETVPFVRAFTASVMVIVSVDVSVMSLAVVVRPATVPTVPTVRVPLLLMKISPEVVEFAARVPTATSIALFPPVAPIKPVALNSTEPPLMTTSSPAAWLEMLPAEWSRSVWPVFRLNVLLFACVLLPKMMLPPSMVRLKLSLLRSAVRMFTLPVPSLRPMVTRFGASRCCSSVVSRLKSPVALSPRPMVRVVVFGASVMVSFAATVAPITRSCVWIETVSAVTLPLNVVVPLPTVCSRSPVMLTA